jgi:class 3 adenylate cyclase
VLDAVGVERAALVGTDVGGWMAMFFAATWPERTASLVLADCCARFTQAPDYPFGFDHRQFETEILPNIDSMYGQGVFLQLAPDALVDEELVRWMGRYERLSAPHSLMMAWWRSILDYDSRSALSAITAPCLVLHHSESPIAVEHGRYLAQHLQSAEYVELPGSTALYFLAEDILDHILPFVTGAEASDDLDRVLLTVLFLDLVDSTGAAQRMGDRRWRELLDHHDIIVRQAVTRWRGTVHKMTGDGAMASFDGPARAARCALAIRDQLDPIGLEVRAGVHAGEVERRADDIGGIAVHVASRIMSAARPGQVLSSRTVKDLTTGSGLHYGDRGLHVLKGVSDEWQLFEISSPPLGAQ